MPTLEALLALVACSALSGEVSAVPDACAQASTPVIECEVSGFPVCLNPMGNEGAPLFAVPELEQEPAAPPLAEPVSWAKGRTETYIPSGFQSSDGTYDLLVHFHGTAARVQPAFQASGFDHAVLVTVNLGIGSGPYEDRFAAQTSFPQLLESIHNAVAQKQPTKDLRLGRVALSSWSAGYGAIKQILAYAPNQDRVDAVLLADGLHAGFVHPRTRTIHPPRLAPFVAFAEEASQGNKLMAVAHSSIHTLGYASTTETAKHLLDAVGLESTGVDEQPVEAMNLTSSAKRRGLRVQGYSGGDTTAHVDHLAHIDGTLLGQLHGWWTRKW